MDHNIRITENIFRLTIPYKDIFTTVYAVHTQQGDLLFDAASYDQDIDQYLLPFLAELGITPQTLQYVFISHNHTDHAGGLKQFMARFPDTCIVSRSPLLKERYREYRFLSPEDGDMLLDVLQVVTIPGHTSDSAAILDARTKTMISGDCLQLYGIFGSGDWAANITLPAQHMQAIEKVRHLDLECIVTAHDYHPYGYKYCGKEAISRALDACAAPLLQIRALITRNPHLDNKEVRALYNASGKLPTVRESVVAAMRNLLSEEHTSGSDHQAAQDKFPRN